MKKEILCFVLCACDTSGPPQTSCPPGVLVATSDFGTASEVGVLPLDGESPALEAASELGADPAFVRSSSRRFFIERDREGNIYEVDACGHAIGTFASHRASESNPDPQDVDVASDGSLWVARFLKSSLLAIGASDVEIDLASADVDRNPNMSSVRVVGERAFVALGLLDDTTPDLPARRPAAMAVVDVPTRTLQSVAPLEGRNPFGAMVRVNDVLWLAMAGDIERDHETDAGIATFSTETFASTLLIPESTIGGTVSSIVIDAGCGAAIAFDGIPNVNHTFLVAFDASGRIVQSAAFGPTEGFDLAGLLWSRGTLLVGDRRLTAGSFAVHTFTRDATCTLTRGADLSLPMAPVAFVAQ